MCAFRLSIIVFLAALVCAMTSTAATATASASATTGSRRRTRAVKGARRRLHGKGKGVSSGARDGESFDFSDETVVAASEEVSVGGTGRADGSDDSEDYHTHSPKSTKSPKAAPAVGSTYSTSTSTLATYDNKCDAAEAGAEFKTDKFVPIYYQYELVTNASRDILEVVDIIDRAIQHFLAVWLVDCDPDTTATEAPVVAPTETLTTTDTSTSTTTITSAPVVSSTNDFNNRQRALMQSSIYPKLGKESRHLQASLAPIVGTGTGGYDIVLLQGSDEMACKSLVASGMLGQVCYKVVGSVLVYLDDSMAVSEADIQALAVETLTVGMNYAATDFTQLDPDIYGLFLTQSYDEAPEALMQENLEANERPWDGSNQMNPFEEIEVKEAEAGKKRSGGAKFGIAFATLLCIVLFLFLCVYMYKNREKLFGDVDWEEFCCCCCCFGGGSKQAKNQEKHASLDDDDTVPSTKYEPSRGRVVPDRSFKNSSPESTATRPLSPEPETPRNDPPLQLQEEALSYLDESNIYTPRSDWSRASGRSTISDVSERYSSPPDGRIHLKLSKEAIRGSHRKPINTSRSYEIEDTVEL